MTLPNNETCVRVIRDLDGDPSLSQWEDNFVRSNLNRTDFSTAQKEVVAKLMDKYECS